MAEKERSYFCELFTMSICVLEINVSKFGASNHVALKLGTEALRSTSSNTKARAAKDHGLNYMKVRSPLVRHLLLNRLLLFESFSHNAVFMFNRYQQE